MKAVEHYEVPHLALWKSCVAEVLAKHAAAGSQMAAAAGSDSEHGLIKAADSYAKAMEQNAPIPAPSPDSDDDLAVQTYLSYLHHQKAHARISDDAALEAQLTQQIQEYKFGNPLWQQMLEQYYTYYWQYPYHLGQHPHYRSWKVAGNGELGFGVIEWQLPANAKVVIVGDIGTGTDVAAAVLVAALRSRPDAILHLGDVYFSGTDFETQHRLLQLLEEAFTSENIRVPFFTVPGNHEYFTGGKAYLQALDSGRLVVSENQKQAASYFCLRSADNGWQFLGMDTGYHGHYMNVSKQASEATRERLHLGEVQLPPATADPHWPRDHNPYFRSERDFPQQDPTQNEPVVLRPDELAWQQHKLAGFSGRSVLLSHHQLYSALDACGLPQGQTQDAQGKQQPTPSDFNREWVNTGLWRQLGPYFDKVAAWLWGHEHNLGIFQNAYRPADWPTEHVEVETVFKTLPLGRCAGHSAIPVQLSENPYQQNYPVALEQPDLKLGVTEDWYNHGFQLLELAGAGQPARLSYYQIAGADPTPLLLFEEQVV